MFVAVFIRNKVSRSTFLYVLASALLSSWLLFDDLFLIMVVVARQFAVVIVFQEQFYIAALIAFGHGCRVHSKVVSGDEEHPQSAQITQKNCNYSGICQGWQFVGEKNDCLLAWEVLRMGIAKSRPNWAKLR